MASLAVANQAPVETIPADLEGKLRWLCRFGKPRLSSNGKGWRTSIEMNTNTTGSTFEVGSEFGLAGPIDAVDQLIVRMLAALAAVTGVGNHG